MSRPTRAPAKRLGKSPETSLPFRNRAKRMGKKAGKRSEGIPTESSLRALTPCYAAKPCVWWNSFEALRHPASRLSTVPLQYLAAAMRRLRRWPKCPDAAQPDPNPIRERRVVDRHAVESCCERNSEQANQNQPREARPRACSCRARDRPRAHDGLEVGSSNPAMGIPTIAERVPRRSCPPTRSEGGDDAGRHVPAGRLPESFHRLSRTNSLNKD